MKRPLSVLSLILVCASWTSAVHAEEANHPTAAQAFEFNIPEQPVGTALNEFAAQSGLQIVLYSDIATGLSSKPISGLYENQEMALAALLANTGLKHKFLNDHTAAIQAEEQEANHDQGKSPPAFNRTLIAQAETPAQQSRTTATATRNSGAEITEIARNTVEEIIVTARKREESLQDVPISISAYSAEDIDAKSLNSLKELAQFTTNFSFSSHPTSASSGAIIYIRGVGQPDSNVFWDPGVGVYLDGVYIGRMQGLDFNLLDLERVEILRGPQGTLFGKNTIGGAINVVSAKPLDEFDGNFEFTTGRYDRIDVKGSINIPLVPGKLAAKFSVLTRNRDGYGTRIDYLTGNKTGEMGDIDSLAGRAMLRWTPSETVDVLLAIDSSRSRENGPPHKLVKTGQPGLVSLLNNFIDPDYGDIFVTEGDYTSFATGGNTNELDTLGVTLTVDWDFGDWAFRSLTSYREVETFHLVDPDGSPYTLLDSIQIVDQDQFSQEFQFSGVSLDDRLDWVFGLYYFEEDAFGHRHADIYLDVFDAIGLDISATSNTRNRVESRSVYGQSTFTFNDKLSMTTGLRFTEDDKDVTGERFRPRTGIIDSPLNTESDSWDAITGRIGFEYRWAENMMTYVSAARGFKSGGINGESRSLADFQPFDPEFIWTYETGFKSDLIDDRLRLNTALFYSDYKNIQFRVFRADPDTGLFITYVDNAAAARLMGFEFDLTAIPAPGLELNLGLGFIDAEYRDIDPDNSDITSATKLVETPKWTVNLSGEYLKSLGDWGDIIGRLDYVYKAKINHDVANNPIALQGAYGLFNGRLTFENADGNWSISVFGTNLTDERYILAGIDFTKSLGFADIQYARPREWGISFRYSF